MTTPTQPDHADALALTRRLAESVPRLADAVDGMSVRLDAVKQDSEKRDAELTVYGRGNRHRIWLTYGLVAVDIILTVVVIIASVEAHNAALSAGSAHQQATAANANAAAAAAAQKALHQANVNSCETGNQYRAGTVASLDQLVTLLEGPKPSARVQEVAAAYERDVAARNMPRNCAKVYAVPKAGAAATTPRPLRSGHP